MMQLNVSPREGAFKSDAHFDIIPTFDVFMRIKDRKAPTSLSIKIR